MKWWETQFKILHPVTYERLVSYSSPSTSTNGRQVNLSNEIDRHYFWRDLLSCDLPDRRVWKETIQFGGVSWQARHAIQCSNADEFGSDSVHQFLFNSGKGSSGHVKQRTLPLLRTFFWNANQDDSVTKSYFDFDKQPGFTTSPLSSASFSVAHMWTVPFRDACLVLLQNQNLTNSGHELVWVQTGNPQSHLSQVQDLRYWTLNRNIFLEDPNDFVVPMHFGDGLSEDESSSSISLQCIHPVLVCSTKDCTAVILEGKICLIFDFSKMNSSHDSTVSSEKVPAETRQKITAKHWRHLLTAEFCEPSRGLSRFNLETAITACCYVLDEFLLLATNDGVIRVRPRCNPKSEYHVESTNSLVSHMISLYNVVAVIHSYCVLEVRLVSRIARDPFIGFTLLYETKGVDCDHAPLLCGPYVIFAGLDGCWYRVMYDSNASNLYRVKEEIAIPHYAGWKIVSVKNANWRYWTVVVQHPVSKDVSEVFLFAGIK